MSYHNAESPVEEILAELDGAERKADILRELVELKRMKDATGPTAQYESRKQVAWRNAFRAFGYYEEPKP